MKVPILLLAAFLATLPLPANPAEPEPPPAIRFARKSFKSAESPLMRWSIKGDKVEGTAPLFRWSASTCPMSGDAPRFEDLPGLLADYCKRNGGRMVDQRCWQTENGREATWFAFKVEKGPCGGHIAYGLSVAELHPSAVGTASFDMEWAQAGFKPDQQVLSERKRAASATANTATFLHQQEQARITAEAPWLKTKGTQVCRHQNNGTFLGYVEDAAGDRIKVLVTQHFWGKPGEMRDNNYRGQEYIWSDLSEWRLC